MIVGLSILRSSSSSIKRNQAHDAPQKTVRFGGDLIQAKNSGNSMLTENKSFLWSQQNPNNPYLPQRGQSAPVLMRQASIDSDSSSSARTDSTLSISSTLTTTSTSSFEDEGSDSGYDSDASSSTNDSVFSSGVPARPTAPKPPFTRKSGETSLYVESKLKTEHILNGPELSPHLTKIWNAMSQKDISKLNELKTELPIAKNVIQAYLHTKFIMDIIPVKTPQETVINLEKYANNVASHEQPFSHAAMKLAIQQRLGLIGRYPIDVGPKFAQLVELEKNLPDHFEGLLTRLAPYTKAVDPNEPPPKVVVMDSSTSSTSESNA